MLSKLFRSTSTKYRLTTLTSIDFIIGLFSFIASYTLLLSPTKLSLKNPNIFLILGLMALFKIGVLYINRTYFISWRYASTSDIAKTFKGTLFASVCLIVCNLLYPLFPIQVFVIDFLMFNLFFFISRFTIRMIRTKSNQTSKKETKNCIIIGAGDAGEMVARELIKHQKHYKLIGFCDDNPLLHKKTIHQAPVLGSITNLPTILQKHSIDQIIIAVPSATAEQFRHIHTLCQSTNIPFKTTPDINELINATQVKLNKLRNVSIVDLLGRTPIDIDTEAIEQNVTSNTILITGAGGSIGSELSRQILQFNPKQLILVDHSEFHLYTILMELSQLQEYASITITPLCLDIKSKSAVEKMCLTYQPKTIFHAAAYKHVPLMEVNADQAILNNIGGTQNILNACEKYNIEQCVVISTDKAVSPSNAMGCTKRFCELLTLEKAKTSKTKFSCVRFGNVLGSYGSVIPLFKEQIKQGGPITITDPKMTRYFMTIKEAVSLVFQASTLSTGGELFVLDMGEPIKITQLANDLIQLSGLNPSDIPITYTGLRPGEKLTESLFYPFENPTPTPHKKIQCCKPEFNINIEPIVQTLLDMANTHEREPLTKEIRTQVEQINNQINIKQECKS